MSADDFIDLAGGVIADYATRANELLTARDIAPGRLILVAPGTQVAWDDCCKGQLWARLVRLEAAPVKPGTSCGPDFFIATLELGIVRCVSTVDDRGRVPSAARISEDGMSGLVDMGVLLEAIQCSPRTRTVGKWTPAGPNGGCAGGSWEFTVRLDNCTTC